MTSDHASEAAVAQVPGRGPNASAEAAGADDPAPFGQLPAVAHIEADRFCDGCFYNLHGQAVRRDPRTGLLLTRCPECGRFACATDLSNAGRLWLHRISTWLVGNWMLMLLGLVLAYAFAQWLTGIIFLEETRWYERYRAQNAPVEHNARQLQRMWITACVVATMFGGGFAGLFTVVVPHWHRRAYAVGLTALTLVAYIVCGLVWHYIHSDDHRVGWAVPHLMFLAAGAIVGVCIGVALGRSVARLLVRMLLPAKLRGPMGYLWEADGRPRPSVRTPS